MRSTDCTLTKQTMGRVLRRTSTKQRSMILVVRSLRHRCLGKRKKASNSGKSRSSYLTMEGYWRRQWRQNTLAAASAWRRLWAR